MKFLASIILIFVLILPASGQESALLRLLSDTLMKHGDISVCIADKSGVIYSHNPDRSLTPASVMKLITTAAAIELLGPSYYFTTRAGYNGELNNRSGTLKGDIVITGGGDPALGSKNFEDHYGDFIGNIVRSIKEAGIRRVKGNIITDDSYYDFQPIPAKWVWEDAGNYYGAGAYGLSVFDNTYEIHFMTTSDSAMQITGVVPPECNFEFSNWLVAAGTADQGYVFAAPYSTNGWLSGSIPANMDDFYLKASIADPPRLFAEIIEKRLEEEGIEVDGEATTARLMQGRFTKPGTTVFSIDSPPLEDVILELNHQSINMYAEHLVKELGLKYRGKGSTEAGIAVINEFLGKVLIDKRGMFIEDGSGLSPFNRINSEGLTSILIYMKNNSRYFEEYYNSLPAGGSEGTLKRYFRDPVFESRLRAKSGSMTRVRSYAGYLTTVSGKELSFSIIVNDFTAGSSLVVPYIEEILKECINSH